MSHKTELKEYHLLLLSTQKIKQRLVQMLRYQKFALSVIVALLFISQFSSRGFSEETLVERIFNQPPADLLFVGYDDSTPYSSSNTEPLYQPIESKGTLFSWGPCSPAGGPDLDSPLVTDRPDFTEASSTVGKGVAQLEFGYTYTSNSDDGKSTRSHTMGEYLLRYGIVEDWLELRVGLFPVQEKNVSMGTSNTTTGTEDLYLGFKIALTAQDGWKPEMAIIPQMTIPTGSNHFSNDETLLGLNWIYSWEINDFISTGGSTQVNRALDETTASSYYEWAQSWTIAYTLTERLGAYTEWYGLFPNGAQTDQTQHYANGGFTYLINNDVQFDVRAGYGLNHAADDYFVGTGLSIRLQ